MLSICFNLFDYHHQNANSPKNQQGLEKFILNTPFHDSHLYLSAASRLANKTWKLLSLFADWGVQLLMKVMNCFHFFLSFRSKGKTKNLSFMNPPVYDKNLKKAVSYEKMGEQAFIENQESVEYQAKNLCQLFSQPIVYENFRNNVFHSSLNNLFNNYNFKSYLLLKNADLSVLSNFENETEKNSKAGIATYDAIVDLYVRRFINRYPEMNHSTYLSSLRFIALTIAIKISFDEPIFNKSFHMCLFPKIEFTPETHSAMEMAFLQAFDFDTSFIEIIDSPL